MKYEKKSTNRAQFVFEVTPEEFEHGLDHAFDHLKEKVELKGFRKGKVPRNIYEQKYGVESLYEEAINHVLNHKFTEAINSKKAEIVGDPKVDFDASKVERGKSFTVSFDVPIKPDVVLGKYKELEVKKANNAVTTKEVKTEIDNLLNKNANLEPKTKNYILENGDTAVFDFEGFKDGVPFEGGKAENYTLAIGSNQFIPGFEEQMLGLKVGEEKDLNVTFPEKYQAEELAGKAVVFKVKLHEIKSQSGETLNDEWVKTLEKENVNTVKELEESIKKDLTSQKETSEKNRVIGELVEQASKNAKVDIPVEMIETEAKQLKRNVEDQAKQYGLELEMFLSFSGLTVEQFEADATKQAEVRVLQTLVVEQIAVEEKLTATKKEIDAKYDVYVKNYNMPIDEIKKYINDDIVLAEVKFEKAIDFLVESAIKK